jgi:hypothetical protein
MKYTWHTILTTLGLAIGAGIVHNFESVPLRNQYNAEVAWEKHQAAAATGELNPSSWRSNQITRDLLEPICADDAATNAANGTDRTNGTNAPSFAEGVKYGLIYSMRFPWEQRLGELTAGASNLWRIEEVERSTDTVSAEYGRIFPASSFDDGVDYGVNVLLAALKAGETNVTLGDIKLRAYETRDQRLSSGATNSISATTNQPAK